MASVPMQIVAPGANVHNGRTVPHIKAISHPRQLGVGFEAEDASPDTPLPMPGCEQAERVVATPDINPDYGSYTELAARNGSY